jgi:hypothetical protein
MFTDPEVVRLQARIDQLEAQQRDWREVIWRLRMLVLRLLLGALVQHDFHNSLEQDVRAVFDSLQTEEE